MNRKKKLQVFVSSTYQDLRTERQAAVEAILSAGHIPAGMELFAAGDKSQMAAIRRWIDESDIFMLILGGRYGSIEQQSGKSYIQLEYEYARERNKPVFAVVIADAHLEEKVKIAGLAIAERDHPDRLREFRKEVMNLLVREWSDPKDIKLAVHETMADFSLREELAGWIPGSEAVNAGPLIEEMARLTKENAQLRQRLSESENVPHRYNGLDFNELYGLLSRERLTLPNPHSSTERHFIQMVQKLAAHESTEPTLAHALWLIRKNIVPRIAVEWECTNLLFTMQRLEYYGIVHSVLDDPDEDYNVEIPVSEFEISEDGHSFLLRLIVDRQKRGDEMAELEVRHDAPAR